MNTRTRFLSSLFWAVLSVPILLSMSHAYRTDRSRLEPGDTGRVTIPLTNTSASTIVYTNARMMIVAKPIWISVSSSSWLGPADIFPGETHTFSLNFVALSELPPISTTEQLILQVTQDSLDVQPTTWTWTITMTNGSRTLKRECHDDTGEVCREIVPSVPVRQNDDIRRNSELSASSVTASFPSDVLALRLGISAKKLVKLRPDVKAFEIRVPDDRGEPDKQIDPTEPNQILTEDLPGEPAGGAMYHFKDGSLSMISVVWLFPKWSARLARDAFLAPCDKLWGLKRELVVSRTTRFEKTDQSVSYRWQTPDGHAYLGFTKLGVTLGKADNRMPRKAPNEVVLTGEEARRVMLDFGLAPTAE